MKKQFIALLALTTSGLLLPAQTLSNYQATVNSQSPSFYFTFDCGSMTDVTGHGVTLTPNATISYISTAPDAWWNTTNAVIFPYKNDYAFGGGNGIVSGGGTGSYYFENSYPVRAVKDAGGIIVGGSDAPVGTRDPQPFVNIAVAVLRHMPGDAVLNGRQALSVREALDAYTIEGARFLGREREFGSLEVGKSADFIIVDRDLLALAANGRAEDIARTRVLETWFRGQRVYRAAAAAAAAR